MANVTFIIGGARSGKSRFAEKLVEAHSGVLGYLATGTAGDAEMTGRIARHRERRGDRWQTLEEPLQVREVILGHDGYFGALLLDCVTLWISNLLFREERYGDPREAVLGEVRKLAAEFSQLATPLVIVSSEVGMGIVPENGLARLFRDIAGEANEILAAAADEVYVCFAGIPLRLKDAVYEPPRWLVEG